MLKSPITISELAQKVALPGQDLPAVAERLRNWTKEGLIKTIGPKATGSGRARHYSWEAVFRAAILNRVTCYFGVRATVLAPALNLAWKQVGKYDYFSGEGQDVWLLIGAPADAGEHTKVTSAVALTDAPERFHGRTPPGKRVVEVPDHMSAAVVMVNVSLIYDRFREQMEDASGSYKRFPDARRIRRV